MKDERSSVVLVQVPNALNAQQERMFLNEFRSFLGTNRPHIVLDCSRLRQMDQAAMHLLLCCLEEALKRNGDVKLAAVPNGEPAVFGYSSLGGLFEVFATVSDATNSFQQTPKSVTQTGAAVRRSHNDSSNVK